MFSNVISSQLMVPVGNYYDDSIIWQKHKIYKSENLQYDMFIMHPGGVYQL